MVLPIRRIEVEADRMWHGRATRVACDRVGAIRFGPDRDLVTVNQ